MIARSISNWHRVSISRAPTTLVMHSFVCKWITTLVILYFLVCALLLDNVRRNSFSALLEMQHDWQICNV